MVPRAEDLFARDCIVCFVWDETLGVGASNEVLELRQAPMYVLLYI